MRRTIIIAMSVCVLGTAGAASAMELQGSIYTEQCYALYVGSADGSVLRLIGSNCAPPPMAFEPGGSWQRPDTYRFDVLGDQQVFLLVWGREDAAEGLLAQFEADGALLTTGDATWQAFRTGVPRDPSDPPLPVGVLGGLLRHANERNAWESVQVGQRNDDSPRGLVSPITPTARWMWIHDVVPDAYARMGSMLMGDAVVFRTAVIDVRTETQLYTEVGGGGSPHTSIIPPHNARPRIGGGGGGGGGSSSGVGGLGGAYAAPFRPPVMRIAPPYYNAPVPVTPGPSANGPRPLDGGNDDWIIPPWSDDPPTRPAPDPKPDDPPPSVPEPGSLVLLLAGVLAGGRGWWRRRHA